MYFKFLDNLVSQDIADLILSFVSIQDMYIQEENRKRVYRWNKTRGVCEPTNQFNDAVWYDRLHNYDIPPGIRLTAMRKLHIYGETHTTHTPNPKTPINAIHLPLRKKLLEEAFNTMRWASHEVCKRVLKSLLLNPEKEIGPQGVQYLTIHWASQLFPKYIHALEGEMGYRNGIDIVLSEILHRLITLDQMDFLKEETISLIIEELDENSPMVIALQNNRSIFLDIWDAIKDDKDKTNGRKLFAYATYG